MPARRHLPLLSAAAFVLALAILAPTAARATTTPAASANAVDCLLPGELRSGASGPTLGARRMVRMDADECGRRGGEFVRAASPPPSRTAVAARTPDDLQTVRCLLPAQVRQLGTRATYLKTFRPRRLPQWQCRERHGEVVSAARYDAARAEYDRVVAANKR